MLMKIKLLLVLQLIFTNNIYSQYGNLDSSFGSNGVTITDASNNLNNDYGTSIIVKDNGTFLVTGYSTNTNGDTDFAIVQYSFDGLLDTSFGNNGIAIIDINGFDDYALSSVLQSDGKIILVGYTINTNKDITIIRLNSDGSLDTSYGNNGIYTFDSGANDSGETVSILPNNKIVVGCNISSNYGVLKVTENGITDVNFGSNGMTITSLGGGDYIQDIKLQSNGKILITGTSSKNGSTDVYVWHLLDIIAMVV